MIQVAAIARRGSSRPTLNMYLLLVNGTQTEGEREREQQGSIARQAGRQAGRQAVAGAFAEEGDVLEDAVARDGLEDPRAADHAHQRGGQGRRGDADHHQRGADGLI